jgi:REP element-mobilizing transposase RayT
VALAYFITFTTYGTWLHGTEKGFGSVEEDHNQYGSPFVSPDSAREQLALSLMTEPPYALSEPARRIVCDAMIALCSEKCWRLHALHVRSNHVHMVVSADREPGRLMSEFKARASRELNRLCVDTQEKRWTRHGSTRHLFTEDSVAAAIDYTLNQQGPRTAHYPLASEPRTK